MHYAYVGILPGRKYQGTCCHACGKTLIKHHAFHVEKTYVREGKCGFWGARIPGVWGS